LVAGEGDAVMKKSVPMLMLPLVALLGACGGGDEVRVTNDENVVLNDSYDNMAFSNDGEDPANATGGGAMGNDAMMGGGDTTGGAMGNGAMAGNAVDSSGTMATGNTTSSTGNTSTR
jgi:hypothetical protein